uniref:Flagellar protein FlgN n=1 Tax=Caldicellulosiruptor owensensis TaxID=55205 RepID=A0A7C5V3T4_9FIRM
MYNKLVSLLEEKERLVDRFLALTSLQQEYILNDNFDELSKIVDEKADLIERINKIDDQFMDEFENIKVKKGIKSFDEITDIDKETSILLKNLTSAILQKLQVIKDIDEKNNILIRAKFDEIKRALKSMRYKKEALKDYSQYKQNQFPTGFDKKE